MPGQVPDFMCLRVQPWGHHYAHGSLGLLARVPFITALPSAQHSPQTERAADLGVGAGGCPDGVFLLPALLRAADAHTVSGCIPFHANCVFFSSRCRLDTYKELLNRPIRKKTEKKTDTPTSFPVRF